MADLHAVLLATETRTYGVDLASVREVVRCGPITPVPSAPPCIVGAVNARGQVVPVVDLGVLLGEGPTHPRLGDAGLWVAVGETEAVVVLGRVVEVVVLNPQEPPQRSDGSESEIAANEHLRGEAADDAAGTTPTSGEASPEIPPQREQLSRPISIGAGTVHLLDLSAALEEARRRVAASVLELSAGSIVAEELRT